jgi:hypothetical protein
VGLYRYLAKAPEPYTLEAHLDHSAAEVISATGRPPRTRRHFLGPQRLAWAEANALYGLTVTPTTSTRGEPAPQGGSTPLQPVTPNPEPSTLPDPTQRPAERPHPPVAKREQLESTSEIPKFPELKGEDGKKRKAEKSRFNQLNLVTTTQPDLTDEPAPVATPQRPAERVYEPLTSAQSSHKANSKTQLRPPHARSLEASRNLSRAELAPPVISEMTRPAHKRLPAPRPTRGEPSPGPAP